jgi:hypothetical protein
MIHATLNQRSRSANVHAFVAAQLIHGLAGSGLGCEMNNDVRSSYRLPNPVGVSDVEIKELYVFR